MRQKIFLMLILAISAQISLADGSVEAVDRDDDAPSHQRRNESSADPDKKDQGVRRYSTRRNQSEGKEERHRQTDRRVYATERRKPRSNQGNTQQEMSVESNTSIRWSSQQRAPDTKAD